METGKVLNKRSFVIIPLTADVITRVISLAEEGVDFKFGERSGVIDQDMAEEEKNDGEE